MEQWENQVEALYLPQAEGMFRLAFVHSCLVEDAELLLREVLGELLTAKKAFEIAQQEETGMLRLTHLACMRYYEKKLRRKIKAENLQGQKLSFPMTDELLRILHLPYGLKSPLVLRLGVNLSPEAAGRVLGYSPKRVEAQLKKAQKRLDMPTEEIQRLLKTVSISESGRQHLFDRVQIDAAEQGFAGKERLKRFSRRMDYAVPFAAALIILLIIGSYMAVRFNWLGTEELSPETQQWLAANSTNENLTQTTTAAVYVPAGDSLKCYLVKNCPADIERLVPLMVSLGAIPEGSILKTATLTYTQAVPSFTAPVTAQGNQAALAITLSEEAAQGITPEMLEAMARTFQAFTQDATTEIHITVGNKALTAEGETSQMLLAKNSPVSETLEIDYR